jgi:hypothetical protein
MVSSAHKSPMVVRPDNSVVRLSQGFLGIDLGNEGRREQFLQDLVFRYPDAIPMGEIEPGFGPLISVCTELPVGATALDNLWMTEDGGIILGECKLVRNPQSRREVVMQALDYAATIAGWSYEDLEKAVGKRRGGAKLWDVVRAPHQDGPDLEAEFADAVQHRLRQGQFMVLLILDGVTGGLETLHTYLQSHAGLHVNLAIVEMSLWKGLGDDILVVPRVPLKTVVVERGIVINRAGADVQIVQPKPAAGAALQKTFTASEAEFFDRLGQRLPDIVDPLKTFLDEIGTYGIEPEFQRSLILRWVPSADLQGSVGYVDAYGSVWLGDAYYSAKKFGIEQAGREFVEAVARSIGGRVHWPDEKNSQLSVRGKTGKIARAGELLEQAEAWKDAIKTLVEAYRYTADRPQ